MEFTKYVAGFLFRAEDREVALICKTKPDWQRGKLNGIGGKVEGREGVGNAMVREFQEETGHLEHRWTKFCTLQVPHASVSFFKCSFGDGAILRSTTEEEVYWFTVESLLSNPFARILPNLRWLIPMALCSSDPVALVHSEK